MVNPITSKYQVIRDLHDRYSDITVYTNRKDSSILEIFVSKETMYLPFTITQDNITFTIKPCINDSRH